MIWCTRRRISHHRRDSCRFSLDVPLPATGVSGTTLHDQKRPHPQSTVCIRTITRICRPKEPASRIRSLIRSLVHNFGNLLCVATDLSHQHGDSTVQREHSRSLAPGRNCLEKPKDSECHRSRWISTAASIFHTCLRSVVPLSANIGFCPLVP